MRLDLDFQVDITQVPAGPLSLASIEWAGAQPPITQGAQPAHHLKKFDLHYSPSGQI